MNNESNRKLLSIIVPCFNEAKVLEEFHAELTAQLAALPQAGGRGAAGDACLSSNYDHEIIYVNDGSTDATQEIIRNLAAKEALADGEADADCEIIRDPAAREMPADGQADANAGGDVRNENGHVEDACAGHGAGAEAGRSRGYGCGGGLQVRYISFSRNFGKEAAMLAGLEYAKGDCAVIMDADLQHPPELIKEMLVQYELGFDQVIAKRDRKGDPMRSAFFAKMYYKLVNLVVDVKMEDGAGDFRLLSRAAIDAVLSLKETNRFSKGIFSWVGGSQTYIEYENRQRAGDSSHWSFRKLLRYGIDGVVSFNVQPLRVCVYLGISLLVLSMLYLLYLLIQIARNGIDVPGYFTTIAMIAVIGGVQLISLGVIGEYVGRIYAEVKNRPAYIIAEKDHDAEK